MDQRESTKVKGLAVLLLLFHHLFYSATRMEENQMVFYLLPEQVVQNAALAARVCVWMFAFLSAFGLTRKYMELASPRQAGEIGTFLRRRWISLMKPYWFVFVLLFLASFILFQNPLEVYQRNPVYIFLGFLPYPTYLEPLLYAESGGICALLRFCSFFFPSAPNCAINLAGAH